MASLISGILLAISWPATGGLSPLLFVALVPLLAIEDSSYTISGRSDRLRVFRWSYLAFLIWNAWSTWWVFCVSESFMTKAISFAAPVFINPLFQSTIFILFHYVKKARGALPGYIFLITGWIAWEHLHMLWDLSWPWLTLGNGFANTTSIIQWYEYTGVFGGSLWVLLANILIYQQLKSMRTDAVGWQKWKAGIIAILWIVLPMIYSVYRFQTYQEKVDPVDVVVVQPNMDPYSDKFYGMDNDGQCAHFLKIADELADDSTDYIVAPETAIPFNIWENDLKRFSSVNRLLGHCRRHPNTTIITGISTNLSYGQSEEAPTPTSRAFSDGSGWYDSFNTGMQVDNIEGISLYHKSKLVVGVEIMPFPSFFQKFQSFIYDLGGTVGSLGRQEERSVFFVNRKNLAVGTPICYESIYGDFSGGFVRNGAKLLFVITNDGWWADTPGYKQHMAYARLLAIEHRRSVARSANTGISCFINQRGDVLKKSTWWKEAAIREQLNANDSLTFYTRYGDYIARISLFMAALLLLMWLSRNVLVRSKTRP